MIPARGDKGSVSVAVWDIPTRLFHWLLATTFVVAWVTHEHDRYLDLHVFAGYVFLGLLLFRLVWGFAGGRYARFREFGRSWTATRDYLIATLRGQGARYLGHNPAGAWAIFAMLGLGLFVSISGLLTFGWEERHGPFAGWLSFEAGEAVHAAHEAGAVVMLAFVAIHVAGVAFESWWHRENLVAAMVTGRKRGEGISTRRYGMIGVLLLLAVFVGGVIQLGGYARATADKPYPPFAAPSLPVNATWQAECGSCHLAFHPALLPARSWEALLRNQHDHFGDDLALDAATLGELRDFSSRYAAESALTEAAWKINRSVRSQDTPLRITDTDYWKRKHRAIADGTWANPPVRGKTNCAACHLDAERGTFEDAAMRVPDPDPSHSNSLWR